MKKLSLLILLSLCGIGSLFAGGSKEDANTIKPLIVAMELQYPPFETSDTDGNPTGVSVDIAKALAEYLGRPIQIENTAWTGLIPSLQTGKANIIISSMGITDERAKVVDFSDPYIKAGLSLLISNESSAKNFSDLNQEGMIVAVKSGTTGAILAQSDLPLAEARAFEDVAACVLEVVQGKADAFIYDPLTVYENHIKHKDSTWVNVQSIPGTLAPWAMAVKKGNPEFLADVNAFIAEFQSSGGFDKLGDKYLEDMKKVFEENDEPFFFDF